MLSKKNKIPIIKFFNKACENGDIKTVNKILFDKKIFGIDNFLLIYSNGFNLAYVNSHIGVYELLKSKLIELKIEEISSIFNKSIEQNNMDLIKYFLESDRKDWQLLHLIGHQTPPLVVACTEGYLEMVKYLSSSDKIYKKLDVSIDYNRPFKYACDKNQIEIIDFLLTSNLLENNINVHVEEDYAFRKAYNKQNKDLLNYLIFDYQIEKTPLIIEIIKRDIEIERLFYISELNNKLPDKQLINKKKKI